MFPNKIYNISAMVMCVVGITFLVVGIIMEFIHKIESAKGIVFIVGGVIIANVAPLLINQVKLQSHLTRIEEKIDKRVNNS